jgi:superfamily I DNA/RNA helicase
MMKSGVDGPAEGFAEISRKRSYSRPSPPNRVLSSIHKTKGLECDNVLFMACDKNQFTSTSYAKCKMYVALSRAKKSLTLDIPDSNPSPLFKRA